MILAIQIVAVDPSVGGVLVLGDRGTGKSTAVRGLADLLPSLKVVAGCPYGCDPAKTAGACAQCSAASLGKPKVETRPVPVVDLPLGASEDRVVGALDLEKALSQGVKSFAPGLLAQAHRGFLYIDEVNLLEDHLVDLLLDVAASGENVVERDGLSVRHPARVVLVGSGNPEEGELRPQLLDRFGLSVEVRTPTDVTKPGLLVLGVTAGNPQGARGVSAVVVEVGASTKTLGTDYEVDAVSGGIFIPAGSTIVTGDDVIVTYNSAANTRERMVSSGTQVKGELKMIAYNPEGTQKDILCPSVTIAPNGDLALKGEDWLTASFSLEVLAKSATVAAVYIDGRPA